MASHRRWMMNSPRARAARFGLVLSFGLAVTAGSAAPLLAQEATPAAALGPTDPANCTIAPRTAAEFARAAEFTEGAEAMFRGTPIATPVPPTGGAPADQATVDAVTETMNRFFACINAGDFPRLAATMSDDFLAFFFGGADAAELATLQTPTPLPLGMRADPPVIEDVRVLPDGLVTARVLDSSGGDTLAVFVEADGRYLLDFTHDLTTMATPTP